VVLFSGKPRTILKANIKVPLNTLNTQCSTLKNRLQKHSTQLDSSEAMEARRVANCGLLYDILSFGQTTTPLQGMLLSFGLPSKFTCISQAFFVYMMPFPLEILVYVITIASSRRLLSLFL